MRIQTYQIHNVLNLYKKKLSEGRSENWREEGAISTEKENKQVVMEKVAAGVIEKITQMTTAADSTAASSAPLSMHKSGCTVTVTPAPVTTPKKI
ncbi:hypothetical protein LJC47_07060 [Desulfosarcina sp. OttesenSCG-928-B08]|nr:hypothetical protein [Desulfosarcina sp. OttesenSCG-928-B08]